MKQFGERGSFRPMTDPTPTRRPRRRWWKVLAIVATLGAFAFALIPWLLNSSFARSRIAARINQAFAPGRIDFDAIQVSWFRSTRLDHVILSDPKGVKVATIPRATLNLSLTQLVLGKVNPAVLTLEDAKLAVERRSDGKIDLIEALQTIIASKDPNRDLTINIDRGSLVFKDAALGTPLQADTVDLTLRIPTSPQPIAWSLKLLNKDAASMEVDGDFDHWLSRMPITRLPQLAVIDGPTPNQADTPEMRKSPEIRFQVKSKGWPIHVGTGGVDAVARLDGVIYVARKKSRWETTSSDTDLHNLVVQGKALRGDMLALDRINAVWAIDQTDHGWTINRLKVDSQLGDIKAEGNFWGRPRIVDGRQRLGDQRIEGRLDLAAIIRQLPHALQLREGLTVDRGSARLTIDAENHVDHTVFTVEAKVADLAARDHDRPLTLRDPATLSARLVRKGDASTIEQLSIKTAFLDASAEGKLDEGVSLGATLDLAALRLQLADWVDLGKLDFAGRASLTGTYRANGTTFENALKANIRELRVDGVTTSPIRRDSLTFETNATGPADSSGLPNGWTRLLASTRSGEAVGQVEARANGNAIDWSVVLTGPLTLGERTRNLQAGLSGTWSREKDAGRYPFLVQASTVTRSVEPNLTPLLVRAEGLLDLNMGEFRLQPVEGFAAGSPGITIHGIGQSSKPIHGEVELAGDLESIDRIVGDWLGRAPLGLTGRWTSTLTATGEDDGFLASARLGLVDPAPSTNVRPTSMTARAHYSKASDRLDLSEFTVSTAYGTVDASGRVDDLDGLQKVDLKGLLNPDFAAINALLAQKVEPGARIEGSARPFRAIGSIGEGGFKNLDAELGFNLDSLDIFGMKVGPAPIMLHGQGGKWNFEPISTTLNEGHIRLEPELDLDAQGGPTLRLAKNSTIRDARINDEVSRRVLAYVAPILDRATRAKGRVTVDLDHAEFPLGAGRSRQAKVEGAVVFNDVEFAPGPLANDILSAAGRRDVSLKLDQPLTLTIADGRVNQTGLSIPIGNLTRIELAGWVDFDRNLALTAVFPVTAAMLGNNEILADIAAGTMVRVPITGTLNQPRIDRDILNANLQEMGKSLLIRGATRGALELLLRRQKPKDPAAPPPAPRLTPEERKEIRMERKAERKAR